MDDTYSSLSMGSMATVAAGTGAVTGTGDQALIATEVRN